MITLFFFFNNTATTEIYTLSLHELFRSSLARAPVRQLVADARGCSSHDCKTFSHGDRKSTRLNSSHTVISYAVFCLKKKKGTNNHSYFSRAETSYDNYR